MMKIHYEKATFTAKCNGKTVRGTFTPNGTPEHFFNFLQNTAKKLGVAGGAGFERERRYEWGTTVWATTNCGEMVIFLR